MKASASDRNPSANIPSTHDEQVSCVKPYSSLHDIFRDKS